MTNNEVIKAEESEEAEMLRDHQPPPQDRLWLCYVVFFVFGTGTLFPWNVLITETAYFNLRFHTHPFPQQLADNFESTMAVLFQLPNLLVLVAFAVWKLEHRIRSSFLVVLPLAGIFVLMMLQVGLTKMPLVGGGTMLGLTLSSAVALGIFTSVLNAGGWSLVSCLPPVYAQGFMTGQAVAGLAVAGASFVTTLAGNPVNEPLTEILEGAFLYFLTALVDIAIGILGFVLLGRLRYFRYFQTKQTLEASHMLDSSPDHRPSNDPEASNGLSEPLLESLSINGYKRSETHICGVAVYRLAVCLNFGVTLSLFPGVTSMIHSVAESPANRLTTDLFVPLGYVLFNAGDLLGRLLAGCWPKVAPRPKLVLAGSILRLIFVPLILLCYIKPIGEKEWFLPVWFANDAFPHLFILLMATTNGFLGSICMMHACSFVEPEDRKSEGTRMALSLIVGCTTGCFVSLFTF